MKDARVSCLAVWETGVCASQDCPFQRQKGTHWFISSVPHSSSMTPWVLTPPTFMGCTCGCWAGSIDVPQERSLRVESELLAGSEKSYGGKHCQVASAWGWSNPAQSWFQSRWVEWEQRPRGFQVVHRDVLLTTSVALSPSLLLHLFASDWSSDRFVPIVTRCPQEATSLYGP